MSQHRGILHATLCDLGALCGKTVIHTSYRSFAIYSICNLKTFLTKQWFLLALAAMLIIGILGSSRLAIMLKWGEFRNTVVFGVLFLMAWPLETSAISRTVSRPWAALLATCINLGLLPLFAWGVSLAMSPLGMSPLVANGLMLAAATPCTLASASVWTRKAEGNDSVAIMVTVITSLVCFVVTPLWLQAAIGKTAEISLLTMITKLGLLVVTPMVLAQLTRLNRPLAKWATTNKKPLSVVAQMGLLVMVLLGAIKTGQQIFGPEGESLTLLDFFMMIAAVLLIHATMLAVGVGVSRLLRFPPEDQIAVGISGSQKTLMVGITAGLEIGQQVVSIMPLVAYHVCQLIFDTFVADWWRERYGGKSDS